ncbi:MAG TPA: RDD family protein [Burkholderiales bacterium]|nr:RDD family protein [Burkholderiales bacterium]
MKDAPCSGAPVSLFRRLSSLFYEMVLLTALLMIGTLPFVLLGQDADRIYLRPLLQLYLLALTAVYFAWQWLHGGQTLPMKTWRLKLVARDGGPLSTTQAVRRLIFALAGTLALGLGFLWALRDPERLFLHDRLAGTRIVSC